MFSTSVVNTVSFPTVAVAPPSVAEPSTIGPVREFPVNGKNVPMAAYNAARQIIVERYPQAGRISDFMTSPVDRNGNDLSVIISADILDAGGNSMRSFLRVDLELQGKVLKLKAIQQ
jgi:hypothetical protein